MINNLSANAFNLSSSVQTQEFIKILAGFVKCYQTMICRAVSVPKNDENAIRDIFLNQQYCLKNYQFKQNNSLGSYLFDKETSEGSGGRTDIRVLPISNLVDEDAYYIIECKRLNDTNTSGETGLNAEYIKEGIMRFTSKKYSTYYSLSGMIGFVVEKMDVNDNTNKINILLSSPKFKGANTVNHLKQGTLNKFSYYYQSKHKDSNHKIIDIHHLMLDFSSNITP